MNDYPSQWLHLKSAIDNQRFPQALLLVGPPHCHIDQFTTQLIQLLFCKHKANEPCFECLDCQMALQGEHPDVEWIKPDKPGSAIKIDQIRELHHTAYLTPQRVSQRVIVIDAAERMNTASANALLKILEEPAPHTLFILLAQQLSTVLPTILSRCQIVPFAAGEEASYSNNLLLLAAQYSQESERALIVQNAESILDSLIGLIEGKGHPCSLATQWLSYELNNFLWFLYLVLAQLQHMYFNEVAAKGPAQSQLNRLSSLLDPVLIFMQLDKINTLIRKLSHNINVNHTLVLEELLFSLSSRI